MLAFLLTIADHEYLDTVKKLYRLYHNDMIKFAYSLLKKKGVANPKLDCEDAVQSALYRITIYIDRIDMTRSESAIRSYIFSIVANEVNRIAEASKEFEDLDSNIDLADDYDLIEEYNIKESYNEIVSIVSNLDPIYSFTLNLWFFEEKTVKEISEIMGVSESTVYTRIRRGKQMIINALKGEDSDGDDK